MYQPPLRMGSQKRMGTFAFAVSIHALKKMLFQWLAPNNFQAE